MKLKQKLAATAIATLAATTTTSVLANTGNTLPVADAFTASDMVLLFEQDAKPLQLAALSEQEMQTTEGAWGPWGAVAGGISGLGGYAIGTVISGSEWSWTRAATSTANGAIAGGYAGPAGVIWGFNANLAFETINGISDHY